MTLNRRSLVMLAGIWAAACLIMTWACWQSINEWRFPDPDDAMRLAQVRDWIGGHGWFEVVQYRLNPPAGVHMHWSRLVDIPIAAVILLARPLLGQYGAETAALIAVPLLTLGIAMLLVHAIALKLMGSRPALVAALATPVSLGALKQMRPMRIDHHGWQIVMALVAILAALDPRPRRSGLVAGIAMALWLNISIEGLPFAAALGALFAWRWRADAAEAERLNCYLASLAVTSLLAFGLTHLPSTWLSQPRDVVTAAHLAAFAVAALVSACFVRASIQDHRVRLAIVALILGCALVAVFGVDPHWLTGPFGSLPPLVREMWFNRIDEGLPVWRIGADNASILLAQPLVGMFGASVALWISSGPERKSWATYFFLLGAATVASLFVARAATTASVLAMPATAFLFDLAFRNARKVPLMPVRVGATAAALCVMAPAYAVPLSVTPADEQLEEVMNAYSGCVRRSEVEKLRMLPTGEIAAPLDITPAIIVDTPHRSIASSHHRNAAAMEDVIRLFIGPADRGAAILARRKADYLVICPGARELILDAQAGPNGLAALLQAGEVPLWLEPVKVHGLSRLKVWRVRQDLIGKGPISNS